MAATPPPLHPEPGTGRRPVPPPHPSLNQTTPPPAPQSPTPAASSDKRTSKPLIIGLCIAGVALITALVLWLLVWRSSGDDTYSSGDNNPEKVRLNDSVDVAPPPVDEQVEEELPRTPIAGYGFNDRMPFYLSLNFDGDRVSGRFTNIIYGLQFPVSGTVDGSTYSLTIGKGSEESHMTIHDIGGCEFTGTWGKNDSPVSAQLYENATPSAPHSSGMTYTYEGKFSGGGVTHDVVMLFSSDFDSGIMYYPRIGSEYAMNFVNTDPENSSYTLYAHGRNVATLRLNVYDDDVYGTMTDAKGREFSLSISPLNSIPRPALLPPHKKKRPPIVGAFLIYIRAMPYFNSPFSAWLIISFEA